VEPWGLLHQGTETHLPQIIGPQSAIPILCTFSQADVAAMANGHMFGYLLGDVRYQDIFDPTVRHVTQFSNLVTVNSYRTTTVPDNQPWFNVDIQMSPVGGHNCADDDCPND
jgi:hypothetical protein